MKVNRRMPLVIFRNKDRNALGCCLECTYLGEAKADSEQYKSTKAVVCTAPHDIHKNCYVLRWMFVDRTAEPYSINHKKVIAPKREVTSADLRNVLEGLRRIGKK